MSDMADLDASYCVVCGSEVQQAQSVNADDSLDDRAQGVYEKVGAHVVIDGSVVSVYVHGDSEAVVADGGTITADPDPPTPPQVIGDVLDDATGGVNRQVLIERVAELSGATLDEVEEALGREIRHGRAIVVDGEVRKTPNRRFAGGGRR
jgi:hypothetical protein